MEQKKCKVGLIGVGHGPRIDNRSGVRNWFAKTGADVEILERSVFDDMEFEKDIAPLLAGSPPHTLEAHPWSPDTRCGGFVRKKGDYDLFLGQDWTEIWTTREWTGARVQKVINELENDDADVIVMCCCLKYPNTLFKSRVPVVFPWKCSFNIVKMLAETMERPQIGIVDGIEASCPRDYLYWADNEWARNVDFYVEGGLDLAADNYHSRAEEISEKLRKRCKKLDLLVIWGWHWFEMRGGEIGGPDVICLEQEYHELLGCPVISSVSTGLQVARCLVTPPIDEKSYLTPYRM